jgi:hypothetical protein
VGRTALALALVAGGGLAAATTGNGASQVSGSISIAGIWTGDEQASFQAVLSGFKKVYPNVKVRYQPAGDNLPTVLSTAVQGGNPPDLAAVGQPGLLKDFATRNKLKPITFARAAIAKNYAADWIKLGTVKGKLYGLVFKGANKSTVWYSPPAFANAGVKPPASFTQLLAAGNTIKASGLTPYSIGGGDGWPLTDLFENIYLRQAGPIKYDQLATHAIPWTDASVKAALRTMGQVVQSGDLAGGTSGTLQTDFPGSVTNVFGTKKAAMVFEGDFVAGEILANSKAKPITGFNFFPFPKIGASKPSVMGGGDTVIMFKDSPAARALVSYLATPAAATIWAKRGGFSSPNRGVKASAYTDPITRRSATQLALAKTFRFDLSDLQPASFGGTAGQGLWKDFQDFVKNPSDVDGAASAMEADAKKAYGGK